jgi:WD40 repeat protein/DNA-binding SARP family transcriptional activator
MAQVAAAVGTEIRILGPVELWRDGELVHVGGPRQRALLLLLVLRANETVSSARLLEVLFGADAVATSTNAVQAAVSRLRRLVEPGALETRGAGYVLHVDSEQLDSIRFERLLAEGRAQLAGGDAATAAATLRDALSLWRGSPLGDLAALEFAQADARRLDELRMVGLMDRVEAELELGAAHELVPELEALVAENPLRERLRGQLMLALYRCGRQADALAVYRETRRLLRDELGLEPSRALQELERAILRQDAGLEPAAAAAEPVVLCPFKGLAAFTTGDAAYYFGRERLVDEVIARLVDHPFVGLVGSSGSGKSSLLQAGVLSALSAGALPGSSSWRRALVRPGEHPLSVLPGDVDLLAVDQLEEAFTTCRDDPERAGFFDELARRAGDGTVVLVALRADFYGRCAAYPAFASLLSANHVLLGGMHRDELAHAIEGPAERAGLQAERELVELVVGDVAGEPGALPLLSTTLVELWRRRSGRVLSAASYRESGGVRGAVARLAEDAFGRLSAGEQRAARGVMLRLADEEDGAIVRRRVPIEELDVATDDDVARAVGVLTDARLLTLAEGTVEVSHESLLAEWPRLRAWLDEDRDGRRLRAHLAAAAREWDARGREPADLYRGPRLGAALDWSTDHAGEPNALEREFLEAARLENERELTLQRRRNRRLVTLLAVVGVLLALAVVAGAVAVVQRRHARDQATVALARQLGAEAVSEPRIDRAMLLARESLALDRSLQTEGTLLATLLRSPALTATFTVPVGERPQAVDVSPDGRTIAVVTNANVMHLYATRTRRQVRTMPLANFGYSYVPGTNDLFAAGSGALPFLLVDARTGRTLRRFDYSKLWNTSLTTRSEPVVVSPDGRYAVFLWALVNDDGSAGETYAERWTIARGGPSLLVPLHTKDILAATATRDGRLVVATDGAISTWRLSTMKKLGTARGPRLDSRTAHAALSPDGRTLAYGLQDGTVRFFTPATGATVSGIGAHEAAVIQVAFSPDSRLAVSTGDDRVAIVWDPATGRPLQRLVGHGGRVLGAAFTRDGRTLYTVSLDGTVLQWDLGGGRRFGDTARVGRPVPSAALSTLDPASPTPVLAISTDGRTFAVHAAPSTVALYATSSLRRVGGIALAPGDAVRAAAWSGPRLVLGTDHGAVELWKVRGTPRLVRALPGLESRGDHPVRSLATADAGRLVAAVDGYQGPRPRGGGPTPEEGALAVWRDGRLVGGKAVDLHTHGNGVAFSADSSMLAVATDDGRVLVLDPATNRIERTIRPQTGAVAVAFAADGTLATGSYAGVVDLWNPRTGREIGRPTLVAASPVGSIAFDPTGKTFVTTGGPSGGARIWATSTQQQFGADLPGGEGAESNAAYTPDGRYLLVVLDDGTVLRWPARVEAWEQHACAVAGRDFTREEWARLVGSRPYARTC